MAGSVIASLLCGDCWTAPDDKLPVYRSYYSDDASCESTAGTLLANGMWMGRSWAFVAPASIQSPMSEIRREGNRLDLQPAALLAAEANALGANRSDSERRVSGWQIQTSSCACDARWYRSGQWPGEKHRYCTCRLYRKIETVWVSTMHRDFGAINTHNFWRERPEKVREQDYRDAFRLAVQNVLKWAELEVEKPVLEDADTRR